MVKRIKRKGRLCKRIDHITVHDRVFRCFFIFVLLGFLGPLRVERAFPKGGSQRAHEDATLLHGDLFKSTSLMEENEVGKSLYRCLSFASLRTRTHENAAPKSGPSLILGFFLFFLSLYTW